MQPRTELCRKGKQCPNLNSPPYCQMDHYCRLRNCQYVNTERGCFYLHRPDRNLLREYVRTPLEQINLEWLEDLLFSVEPREIQYFLQIFARIVTSDLQALKTSIVQIIMRTKILDQRRLNQFREGIISQSQFTRPQLRFLLQNLHFWNFGLKKVLEHQGNDCRALCVGDLASLLNEVQDRIIKIRNNVTESQFDELYQEYRQIKREIEDLLGKWRGLQYSREPRPQENKARPRYVSRRPDNFRLMSVNPTIDDLKAIDKPVLKELNLKGAFESFDDYLSRNFKLLREDYISRLREGLLHYLTRPHERTRVTYIYPQVQIYYFYAEKGFEVIRLRFHFRRFDRHYSWKRAKKLMYGSLILLSSNNFKTIYLGVIRDRDGDEMNETYKSHCFVDVSVEFVKDMGVEPVQFYEQHSHENFVVIESKAYYEAYYHNLKILQETTQLPFSDLLARVDFGSVQRPDYISEQDVQRVQLHIDEHGKFDKSQEQAIMKCFTKNFSLIQGPPGTGKTYIGAHIVNLILKTYMRREEEEKIQFNQPKKPIYVVCYTNHALDQFLQKFEPFTRSIIRIGGQSSRFGQYGLDKVRLDKNLRRSRDYHQLYDQLKADLQQYKRNSVIMFRNIHLKVIQPLLSENPLISAITQEYQKQLALEALMIREGCGQNLHKAFLNEALKVHEIYKFPEVFHWLGLLTFQEMKINCFSQEMMRSIAEDQELKQEILEDEDAIEDQIQYYHQRIHEHCFFYEYDRIDSLLQKRKGPLHQDKTVQQMLEQNFKATEELKTLENIRNPLGFLNRAGNPYHLELKKRWFINNHLVKEENKDLKQQLHHLVSSMKVKKVHLEEMDMDLRKRALSMVRVVAMTTTGAAKYKNLLKQVNAEIMIVEEAAEVLESHLITAITPSMKHIILIGDHQQLRPPMNVYELGRDYNFDISMFERLINNDYDYSILKHQRRMRPEIADLTRLIYPELKDAQEVREYPRVSYLDGKNLLFFNHSYPERHNESLESKENINQALFVLHFANFLIEDGGYQGGQITILTLYSAQLLLLRHFRKHRFHRRTHMSPINIQTVDNYQGEENDIVLLSLVRSNDQDQIGFLEITNRVCVALSRAKMGFFLFGNAKCFKNSFSKINERRTKTYKFNVKDIWTRIFNELDRQNAISQVLLLKCECHRQVVRIRRHEDFQLAQRFCRKTCNNFMDCGHKCKKVCHLIRASDETPNGHSLCRQVCQRSHPCGHPCKRKCYECWSQLQPCTTMIDKKLDCGHTLKIKCHQANNPIKCDKKCQRNLPGCGHKCSKLCWQECSSLTQAEKAKGYLTSCKAKIQIQLPCRHLHEVECGKKRDLNQLLQKCQKPCAFQRGCGHRCMKKCKECRKDEIHSPCLEQCLLPRYCGHRCEGPCGRCPPCEKPCLLRCPHKTCQKKCHQKCDPCMQPCLNRCKHSKCTRLCSQLCDREPCNEPCQEILKCGHPCRGLCGEKCPWICYKCRPQQFLVSDTKTLKHGRFVTLPDCKCVFEIKQLDEYFEDQFQKPVTYFFCSTCGLIIKFYPRYSNQMKLLRKRIEIVETQIILEKKYFFNKYLTDQLQNRTYPIPNCFLPRYRAIHLALRSRLQANLLQESVSRLESFINYLFLYDSLSTLCQNNPSMLNPTTQSAFDHILFAMILESPPIEVIQGLVRTFNILIVYIQASSGKYKAAQELKQQSLTFLNTHPKDFDKYQKIMKDYLNMVGIVRFKRQLLTVIQFQKKSWYQCYRGHIHTSTSLEKKRKCPECSNESYLIRKIL